MKYELVESKKFPGEWIVEGINFPPEGDGEVYTAIFCASDAKGRAEAYLAWLTAPNTPPQHQSRQHTPVAESASAQPAKPHP